MKTLSTESRQPEDLATDMFPDLSRLELNKKAEGRVFNVLVESSGIGIKRRTIEFKAGAWAEFADSPHFREIYDLSVAKLLLQQAVERIV